ncbi:hypothetical protein PR048_011366, partial [Dryococelus australis]
MDKTLHRKVQAKIELLQEKEKRTCMKKKRFPENCIVESRLSIMRSIMMTVTARNIAIPNWHQLEQQSCKEDMTVLGIRAIYTRRKTLLPKNGDMSTVTLSQVLGVLPNPCMHQFGTRTRYLFQNSVDVNEL